MTKRQLIQLLSAFDDEVEIMVGGCHPRVLYHSAKEGLSAYISFEDDWSSSSPLSTAIQLYPDVKVV